jgi:hypothetical protein
MTEERLETLIMAKPGVSKWGLRGGYGRGVIPLAGGSGAVPPEKNFKLQMHAGEF